MYVYLYSVFMIKISYIGILYYDILTAAIGVQQSENNFTCVWQFIKTYMLYLWTWCTFFSFLFCTLYSHFFVNLSQFMQVHYILWKAKLHLLLITVISVLMLTFKSKYTGVQNLKNSLFCCFLLLCTIHQLMNI